MVRSHFPTFSHFSTFPFPFSDLVFPIFNLWL